MRNVSNKSSRENQNTRFVFSKFFFENRVLYEIMWKNIVERGRSQMAVWRMSIACWITKAVNTQSQYVILIALQLQQWLEEPASVLLLYVHYCVTCSLLQRRSVINSHEAEPLFRTAVTKLTNKCTAL